MRWNFELLKLYCKDNEVELTKDYSTNNIHSRSEIEGKCKSECCDEGFTKFFNTLFLSGAYCKECTSKHTSELKKKNCMDKHGVEHFFQRKDIRGKCEATCMKNYGVKCPFQSKVVLEKGKATCIEKYGVSHQSKSAEVREKYKKTCIEKFGHENPFLSTEIREKITQTLLERYGVEHTFQISDFNEKRIKTWNEKYGVENPSQCHEIREKIKKTCLEKYGVENVSQNAEISEKSSKNAYKAKDYTLPSGNIVRLQGYEKYCIKELLETELIKDNDIITNRTEVPKILYNDADGKEHRYFVDFYIPSQNRCIEVKSEYTVKKENVFLKQNAMKEQGFKCEIWVYNRDGLKVECFY
jgi:hypothetical protein